MVRLFVTPNALAECRGWQISYDIEFITYPDTLGHFHIRRLCGSTPAEVQVQVTPAQEELFSA